MSGKAQLYYVLDAILALVLIFSAVSGLVLWQAGPGDYRGGRNPNFGKLILGLSRGTWEDLHLWISLALIAIVVIHFVLHLNWIIRMTRRLLLPASPHGSTPDPS